RTGGTLVYELLGEQGQVEAEVLRARDLYETALAAYFARRFPEAVAGFRAAADARPNDRAALAMATRAATLALEPPPPDWDGIYHATAKCPRCAGRVVRGRNVSRRPRPGSAGARR